MPKEKTTWRNLHRVKVHHNRWLIWTIAIALFVCAALIGYIQVSDIHFEMQMNYSGTTSNWTTFNNKTAGYSVKYPKSWGVESDGPSSISLVNLNDANEYFSISVYPASAEKDVRSGLFTTKETDVTVNGMDAVLISQNQNQPENVVLINSGDSLYVLRGKGALFARIVGSFKLNQTLERV